MGWKSTIDIERERAEGLAFGRISRCTDEQLATVLEVLGFGEDEDLPYYGHNFLVVHTGH